MKLTLQFSWLLLLILPTVPLVLWRARRAGFPGLRAGLYGLIAAGLVLILAAPVLLPQGDKIPTVYLIDCSDSVAHPQDEILQLAALSGADSNSGAGGGSNGASELDRFSDSEAWLFGRKVMVMSDARFDWGQIGASVDRSGSLYANALAVLERYGADHPDGCALLIGDGLAQDTPEALARAAELRRLGWTLDVMPGPAAGLDLGVVAVETPPSTPPGEGAPIRVRVQANAAGQGVVDLRVLDREGKTAVHEQRPVEFARAGEQAVTFVVAMKDAGVFRVVVRVQNARATLAATTTAGGATVTAATDAAEAVADAQPGNDVGYQLLTVRPEEVTILQVVRDDAKASAWGIQTKYLAEHFADLHWQYQMKTAKQFVREGAVPRGTRLLVLDNIPLSDLPGPMWQSINQYVQVEGGGLLALGGDKAFGAGGHLTGGELERCLPIKMEPPKNRRIDIVLVIDVSASMADSIVESSVRTAKLDAAKEAVWGLLGGNSLLGDDDRIALVAFSDKTEVKLPFTPVKEALTIKKQLAALEAQGATKPAPAVAQAFDLVAGQKADRTFIVFVSDGQPSSTGTADLNFASGQNAAIVELLRKHIPAADADGSGAGGGAGGGEDPAAGPKISFWPVFIGEARGTEPYQAALKEYARFGRGKFIWPQSAGNPHPSELDSATLAGALKKILDAGNKDRFTSDKPFLISPTGQAHPLAPLLAQAAGFRWRNRVGIKPDGAWLWQAGDVAGASAPALGVGGVAVSDLKKPEPLFAVGQYGNGRSAAVAMRFTELAVQARKENPKFADQMIDEVRWLTGAGEPQGARVELRAADAAAAQALNVRVGESILNIDLSGSADRADRDVRDLAYALQRIPMEEASSVPWNAAEALNVATRAAGNARWVSPGRFAVVWPPQQAVADAGAGVYSLALSTARHPAPAGTTGDAPESAPGVAVERGLGRFTLAVPAGPEYLQCGSARAALQALAAAGGGKLIDGKDAGSQWRWGVENQWRASLGRRVAREGRDLRPWVALILAALLIADSALRWLKPAGLAGASPISGAMAEPTGAPAASSAKAGA